MSGLRRWWVGLCMATLLVGAFVSARAGEVGDGKDHPLLSRMPNYSVFEKSVKDFDAVSLQDFEVKGKIAGATFPLTYEGRVTVVKYIDKDERTANIAVYRNYEAAIKALGGRQLNTGFAPTSDDVWLGNHVFEIPQKAGAPITVLLFINSPQWYSLTFIEPKPMVQQVTSGQLADEIESKGFATLHINFDTNKADLKADGVQAVAEIAKLMKGDPALKLSIEGHTDNVGSASVNKKLSGDRAASVMKAVVAQGIDAKRLAAKGYGPEVPIADNRTDEGRAKNRRVELVKQK